MTIGRIQVGAEFGGAATVTVPVCSAPVAMSGTAPTWPVIATPGAVLAEAVELVTGAASAAAGAGGDPYGEQGGRTGHADAR